MPLQLASVDEQYKKFKDLKPEDVKSLMAWAEKQPHLPKISELEIILFLHSCYYSQEAAKTTIDNYYTCRTHCPEFFTNRVPDAALQTAINTGLYYILPGCNSDGHRVIYCRLVDIDPTKYVFSEQLKLFTMIVDTWLLQEGTMPGHIIVFDMEGVSFGHLTKLGLMTMKKYMYYLQEAMPVRLKGLHFIHVVPFMDKILAIMKPFMKKELMDVLHLHTEGMDSFYKFVPKKCLPKDMQGEAPSIEDMHKFMEKDIKGNADYFKQEEKQRVDETKRPGKAKNAGDLFGMEGTFKKLAID
ncbi:uncharacterized protein CBL_13021 [Carabus blaptoides fortunei]